VALRTEAYYRQVAEDALRTAGVTEPPVSIGDLVASLCIPIRPVNLPAFFTAATIYEDGLPVMVVNFAKPEIERRRALAHMLGHVLLLLADSEDAYPRAAAEHRDADLVARELIMPTSLVIEQAHAWFNDYRYLARLFGVTEGVMLDRMRELGLISDRGITWDF
jgi:Zn-dependent peptidase ImmA (M78 family)